MESNRIYKLLLLAVLIGIAFWGYQQSIFMKRYDTAPGSDTVLEAVQTEIEYDSLDEMYGSSGFCIGNEEAIKKGEFIVRTLDEYQSLIRYKSIHFACDNFALPILDFSNTILLAKYASGGGCDVKFNKKVYKDDTNKKVIYAIRVLQNGSCKKKMSSMNWIKISGIPTDYRIEFQVQTE